MLLYTSTFGELRPVDIGAEQFKGGVEDSFV